MRSGVDQGLLCAWSRLALNLLVARACVLVIYIFCLASCMGSTKFSPLRDLSFPVANDKQAAVAFLQSKSSLSHMLYM